MNRISWTCQSKETRLVVRKEVIVYECRVTTAVRRCYGASGEGVNELES
jgi:hypothetical protein